MPSKAWDEITHPFPNFNGGTVDVWERISHFTQRWVMDVIVLGLKLIHVSKRGLMYRKSCRRLDEGMPF